MIKKREVYLDHAATTYVLPKVEEAMKPYWEEIYGNPSSLHGRGREAIVELDKAREKVAKIFNCRGSEIIFTGGGTESDNLALFGVVREHQNKGKHIIITKIEHHAVLHVCEALEKEGFEITYLGVDEYGLVDPVKLYEAIRPDTILVSIMYANNEIGTVEPIADIGREILKYRKKNNSEFPYFHSDACQVAGTFDLDVEKLHVDLMTINGSKIYGPKGVGVLYKKKSIKIKPLIYGGGQEFGLRAGTENLAGIVGLTEALEISQQGKEKENERLVKLRDKLIASIEKNIPDIKLNGHREKRLPNNVNMTFLGAEGEALLLYLDNEGIYVSTGSACTSFDLDPSHVIVALGLPYEYAHGSIRMTLGKKTSDDDIDYTLKILSEVVKKVRKMSPVKTNCKRHPKFK